MPGARAFLPWYTVGNVLFTSRPQEGGGWYRMGKGWRKVQAVWKEGGRWSSERWGKKWSSWRGRREGGLC